MTVRIVGIETEYGLIDRDDPRANPIALSAALVAAYRSLAGASAPWDYGGEDPLSDLRGHRIARADAHPDLLTDAPGVERRRRRASWEDPAHLNAVLPNGARLYVDHAHPEYSSPEVATPRDAVLWDRAGDEVMRRAAAALARDGLRVSLFKNNVDGKGASYGTHENYLVSRAVPFEQLAQRVTAHLVTRQVFTGAGRVGLGQQGGEAGFQISQRADYIEAEAGLETTLRRPIVNTRDEPHADPARWRRLHVILGDANCLDVPAYLKVGTTSLVLSAIEADDARLDALVLADPVGSVSRVSRDLALSARLRLAVGDRATALEVQRALLEICRDHARDASDAAVLARWEQVLEGLARDPAAMASQVEWAAKLGLLARLRDRHGGGTPLPWDDARLAAADIQWSDLDPSRGLAARLVAAGAAERLVAEAEVEAAVAQPPQDTRAWLRGRAVALLPTLVDAAGWSTVVLDRDAPDGSLEVVRLDDPLAVSHPVLDPLIADAVPGG